MSRDDLCVSQNLSGAVAFRLDYLERTSDGVIPQMSWKSHGTEKEAKPYAVSYTHIRTNEWSL